MTASGDVDPADPAAWGEFTMPVIGTFGTGGVTIDDDTDVVSFYGTLGLLPGSSGIVTIDGAGSTWTNAQGLAIANYGDGAVNVTNGGALIVKMETHLGYFSGSRGAVTVTGAGSTWNNIHGVYVGFAGEGVVNVSNGGSVSADRLCYIGLESGSKGELNITNGGVVSNSYSYVGYGRDSTGGVRVSGAGATLTVSHSISLGLGEGRLNIANGGLVSAQSISCSGDSFVTMATGGMLALKGNAAGSLENFTGGTDDIRYWDDSIGDWAHITGATAGEDYTLDYLTEGDLAGYTVLTVTAIPEPGILSLFALGGLVVLKRPGRGGLTTGRTSYYH